MTSHRIGVNLRVSGNCDQGARKYMEDNHVIKFLKKDTEDYEFAYFGVFDGHGGPEASVFCRDNLLNEITKYDGFWTDDDEEVLSAIKKGFLDTHNSMWTVLETWPKTVTGLPSTSGTTCTIAIVKQGKLYTGHVGDSGLVLGENDEYVKDIKFPVQAICVTKDHKPDDPDERMRIEEAGGEVISKSGVPRVVWSRPKTNHKGPVRRSTLIDQIPFLAVARSLGDLWSYDYYTKSYVVSPEPDLSVIPLDPSKHRCLILASDGLWNMLTPEESTNMVMDLESQFEQRIINDPNVAVTFWSNPAERLVARALNKWRSKALKADNTSCVVVLIDPLGPSKLTLLKRRRQELLSAGEMMNISQAMQPPPTEIHNQRSKSSSNYNANCSISDSHIRVDNESILFQSTENHYADPDHLPAKIIAQQRLPEDVNDSINDTLQFSVINTTTEVGGSNNSEANITGKFTDNNKSLQTGNFFEFTKLAAKPPASSHLSRPISSSSSKMLSTLSNRSCRQHSEDEDKDIDVETDDGLSDISEDVLIPQPPPSTPCNGADDDCERQNASDDENSLHSSAEATDPAFVLASDESLESPQSSFEKNRPVTPLSAPAKLTTRTRRHKSAGKGKTLFAKPDPAQFLPVRPPNARHGGFTACQTEPLNLDIKSRLPPHISTAAPTKAVSKGVGSIGTSTKETVLYPSKNMKRGFTSPPPKRVLNNSLSMNDVGTPKTKSSAHFASCTGLTPNMSNLMSVKDTTSTKASTTDIGTHFSSSYNMATDKARCNKNANNTLQIYDNNTSMIIEDSDIPLSKTLSDSDALKQLNKTGGPIRKMGSKRFGNFLRTSKINLDQVFHIGSHRKGSSKKTSHSTSKLELTKKQQLSVNNTSLSTSQLGDIAQSCLPDVTLSHYADYTLDASSLTAGDLTNLSALSADESMLTASILDDKQHHSMLTDGSVGKAGKNKKGFLQKTRFTLRRARKAAKKAFFPENRLIHGNKVGGTKRKSDEFLSTPELKRRKQLMAEQS